MSEEASDLTEELGNLCSGYDMPIVLTALTYLCADACIQSGLGEVTFLASLNESIRVAVQDIREYDNGDRSYH
jgi:tRNA(Arg) A34 adenosine deaminase TadA